jgi:hypothetical protein
MALPVWEESTLPDTKNESPEYARSSAEYLGLVYQQQRERLPELLPAETALLVVDFMLIVQYMMSRKEMSLALRVGQENEKNPETFRLTYNMAVTGFIETDVPPSPVSHENQLHSSSSYDALSDRDMGKELVRLALWETHDCTEINLALYSIGLRLTEHVQAKNIPTGYSVRFPLGHTIVTLSLTAEVIDN